uniref:non-specific protein-tyrosine kinase n=1 Tax=Lutzomyia longipalpis TaxID=7200 RepID=A0A1B0CRZ3_LUTLO
MTSGDNLEWLEELLVEVQLEQFFHRITDDLQITRLVHFNYVHSEDLEKIGLARPAIRRLMEAVRKRRSMAWRQTLMEKILPGGRKKAPRASPSKAPPASTCLILEREISLADKLGDGSFGVVRRGEWRPGGGPAIPVAVKVLKADVSMPGVVEDFFKEVQSMHVLDHPNLIHLHGVVLSKPLMMVTELADRGSLLDTLHTRTLKHLSLMHIWRWAVEVATGMAYLETRRILHRDLACRNVFLHGPEERVKIGDFGLMRSLPQQEDCYVMTEHRRVPFPWCAPESLRLRQFSHASDAWMFGVTLWEMFTGGEEPWVALNGAQVLKKIESGERLAMPELSSPEIYQLMLQCWHRDPQERLSFIDIQNVLEAVQHGERSHSPGVVTLRHSADEGQRVLRRRTFNSADCRRAEAAVANRKSCQPSFQNKKSTESHTKERSYIAAKQFSYNKLRNESNCVAGKKLKPVRPPQPKVEGRVEEGNLIDLSSPDAGEAEAVELRGKLNEMKSFSAECILDTPIEVGTEYMQQQNASEGHDENLPSPVYENSREIDHTSWQSVMMEAYEAAVRSQEHELDPFDTSHVPRSAQTVQESQEIPEVQQNSFDDNWDYIRQLDVSHTPTSEMGYFTPPERETPIKELTAPEVAQESIINEIVAPTEALTLQYSATSNATTNIYDKVDEGSLYQELYPNLPATYQNIPDAWNSPRVYPERVVEAQKLRPHRPAPSIPSS